MRIRSVIPVATLAVASVVALASCASSKAGDGSFAGPSNDVTSTSAAVPSDMTTAPPTQPDTSAPPTIVPPTIETTTAPSTVPPTTEPPTTEPSASSSGGTPHCEGGKIAAPDGAPYCFVVPSGFVGPGAATLDTAQWPVAIQLAAGTDDDIIVTGVFFAQIDTNTISDDVLAQANDTVVASLTGLDFDSPKGTLTKVPGGRNIEYHATDPSTGTKIDMNFVFNGYTKLQVNCQSKTKEADIDAGCKKVIDSVRLVSVQQ